MDKRRFSILVGLSLAMVLFLGPGRVTAAGTADRAARSSVGKTTSETLAQKKARIDQRRERRITQAEREAAADRQAALRSLIAPLALPIPGPGGIPDYFGTTPNWAYSPLIRKFVDSLPGLGATKANNLGQYIPDANPDTTTYPGSDYYEIELRQYGEKMHSDLATTTLRGYVQVNMGTDGTGHNTIAPAPIHYLGPLIIARRDRPVRVKFTNKLLTGAGGDLFLPVDDTVMGAGMGPLGMDVPAGTPMDYTQNRATLHLHGGKTPWISDGTPHQWITPAGENTPYPKGVSVQNVPDMPDPGDGSMTFFYSNQQSARMMFYHDHSFGITRLNVYAGEAAGYLITDPAEDKLVTDGAIPAEQIPLIIQDKTFVDASTIATTDPTWNWGTTPPVPHTGDLWLPHVYLPNQNPYDPSGANPIGRWDYGPWFWPPTNNLTHPPIANPYYDPINAPWEPPVMPATPNPSMVMETFMDTPLVNGTAYPYLQVDPKAYRFRILNAANDRFWNLQLYEADPSVVTSDSRTLTEVKMVPAAPTPTFPDGWPTDGRDGGVPDPGTLGPDFIQIATEGGFLPAPAVVKNQPVDWNRNMKDFTFGNVSSHALLLGPAERADVLIDFSQYAGKTLILYNDAPAAFPARDPRLDYYTGCADQTDTGGTLSTRAGFGPNTRTIMQIKVAASPVAPVFDLARLEAVFASTASTQGAFASSQPPVIMPTSAYSSAYNTTLPADAFVRIQDTSKTFRTVAGTTMTLSLQPKGIHDEMGAAFDEDYGRMAGKLGVELPFTSATTQNFVLYGYQDPATEIIKDSLTPMSPVAGDGTQIWKITHNGVDTHPIHFHLFEAQLINRVGWDGAIRAPDENELGWKDTLRINPLEDTIVALRPTSPKQPFGLPDSIRPLDPTMPLGSPAGFANLDPLTGQPIIPAITNTLYNFRWEYMWHCHILSHEEMEMMRPIVFEVDRTLATPPILGATGTPGSNVNLSWTDATPPDNPGTLGNPANEVGFRVQRAAFNAMGVAGPWSTVATALANATSHVDTTTAAGTPYNYRVVAFNAAGDSPSNVIRVSPAVVAPAPPTGLTAVAQLGPKVLMTWTDNANSETGFVVERAVGAGPFAMLATVAARAGTGAVSYTDTGVTVGSTYSYRVKAVTGALSSAYSNTATVTVTTGGPVRIYGPDRYATSVAAAKDAFPNWGAVTHIILASGADPQVDALPAAGLGRAYAAPVLLCSPRSLPAVVSQAIDQAGTSANVKLHLVGNTLSASTRAALLAIPGVDPTLDVVAGADRYGTSQEVAKRMRTVLGVRQAVFFVNGADPARFADGAVASAIAAKMGFPTLLVRANSVPVGTFSAVGVAGATERYIVGGAASVSEQTRITLQVPTANRWSGPDRYATSVAVAANAAAKGWLGKTKLGIAATVPDALSGGAAIGTKGGPLLLTSGTFLPAVTRNFLVANKAGVVECRVYGSPSVVSNPVFAAIDAALR